MLGYFRLFLVGVFSFFVTIGGTIGTLFRPFHPGNVSLIGRIFRRGIFWILGVRIIRIGRERYEDGVSRVYVANHQSNWDMFLVGGNMPPRTVGVGKKEIGSIPLFGLLFRLAGNILIDRKNRDSARNTIIEAAQTLRKYQASVAVLPEGTRGKGKALQPFKKGAFFLAVEGGFPIVPVVLTLYYGRFDFNRFRSGTVEVRFLDEISTEGYAPTSASMSELASISYEIVKKELETMKPADAAWKKYQEDPA